MKIQSVLLLVSVAFCRSLLAGENSAPSRASTLLQEKPSAKPEAASCCAVEKPGQIENRKSRIENLTADSIYQLDAKYTTDSGQTFTLSELRGRPVVLDMFFASCGYACPLLVTDMQAIREKLPAGLRDRAVFVLVSFDVAHDTPTALAQYRVQRGLDSSWILLHGSDDAVRELAALLGVKYKQDADGMFSHSNILTVLNPAGEITHQRTGLKGGLDEAAAALVSAAQ